MEDIMISLANQSQLEIRQQKNSVNYRMVALLAHWTWQTAQECPQWVTDPGRELRTNMETAKC